MFKHFKEKAKGLITGIIIGSVVTGGIAAFAAHGNLTIDVFYNNIKLVVDGILVNPTDANGNAVEPFLYNGTTYLPVRAIGNALGKEVRWDDSTSTVYLGGNSASGNPTNSNEVLTISMQRYMMGGVRESYIGSVFHVEEVSSLSADATTVSDLGNFIVNDVETTYAGGSMTTYLMTAKIEVPNVDISKPYRVTLVSLPSEGSLISAMGAYGDDSSQYIIVDENTVILYPSCSAYFRFR